MKKNNLKQISETLEKEDYYQNCLISKGHAEMYLLMIKNKNEIKVEYYSPECSPFGVKAPNENFKLTQKVFEILYRNYYKKF